jgi:hypothetical protein
MTLEELQAENEALRDRLDLALALADCLADRLDAGLNGERPRSAAMRPRCRFALPPHRLRTVWAGEDR